MVNYDCNFYFDYKCQEMILHKYFDVKYECDKCCLNV